MMKYMKDTEVTQEELDSLIAGTGLGAKKKDLVDNKFDKPMAYERGSKWYIERIMELEKENVMLKRVLKYGA